MRTILKTMFAAAAICASAFSCTTPDPLAPDDSKINGDTKPGEEVATALTAVLESTNKTAWAAGEGILIYDGTTTATATTAAAGATSELSGITKKGTTSYIAYWPAADKPAITAEGISTSVPVQQAAAGSVDELIRLVAAGSTSRLLFNDVYTYVSFTTSMTGVDKITFTSNKDIAGDITISFSNGAPVISARGALSKSIEVAGPFEAGKTYYFRAIPNFNGTITATATAGGKDYEVEGLAQDFMVGKTAALPEVYKPNPLKGVYQISHLWVYGGTGPEYGGGKCYDLYDKAGLFVSALGRGIEAEKDNYIEVTQDGAMYNWAGEDGKHSRFVLKAAENKKQKGYPVELESFYRVLPKGQSAVAVDDEGKVTITDASGNTVTGTVVPAGKYYCYNGTQVELNITTVAIRFNITNGKDDWSNIYSDYDVVAAKPRALFIELQPMEKGFQVPGNAKTNEVIPADEVLDPDEPIHSSFDFSKLPGSWGFDSAAKDLKVLGGCGSDPAFVGPVDKSWCWNDSIWKIGDDRVEISSEGGKWYFNYWSGNDGKFWDCVYKDGTDLSKYYGQLPKGKHEVVFNLETFKITLSNGAVAQFYTPGTYQFSQWKKEAIVPDDCFAIWFDFNAPSGGYPENSSHWTDIDRFCYSPYGYLMIFHKK